MLVLFIVVFGFFWLFNISKLPISVSEFINISGQDGLLDTKLFYTAQQAYDALTVYGEEGRQLYMRFLMADFVFLATYSLAFAFLLNLLIHSICSNAKNLLFINTLPLAIGLFDFIENISIVTMLQIFPEHIKAFGVLASIATPCKWILTVVTIGFIAYGIFILLINHLGYKPCCTHQ